MAKLYIADPVLHRLPLLALLH